MSFQHLLLITLVSGALFQCKLIFGSTNDSLRADYWPSIESTIARPPESSSSDSASERSVLTPLDDSTVSQDRSVLVALYDATNGSRWTRSDNWLTDRPLNEWYGVHVDQDGRVTRLDLRANDLRGRLPDDVGKLGELVELWLPYNDLVGEIPPAVGELTNLESLWLAYNQLSGGIPRHIADLHHLEYVHLWSNRLTGPIPEEFGRSPNLTEFYVGLNHLSGVVPAEFAESASIRRFGMMGNPELCVPETRRFVAWLSELISHDVEFSNHCNKTDRRVLARLYEIAQGSNWHQGDNWLDETSTLESWFGVRTDDIGRVIELNLSNNGLVGTIPFNLGELRHLQTLRLQGNDLSGRLPLSLIRLALEEFSFDSTDLCVPVEPEFLHWFANLNTIPSSNMSCSELGDRLILEVLYSSLNGRFWTRRTNWLTDAPLAHWYGVRTNEEGRVTEISFYNNELKGEIPLELTKLDRLRLLRIQSDEIHGEIPAEIRSLEELTHLTLRSTFLTGSIPSELGDLKKLTSLDLANNQLYGPIPSEIGKLEKLRYLGLENNHLNGTLPKEIGNLTELTHLLLFRNAIGGPLPTEIGDMKSLEVFWSWFTSFSGPIPKEIGSLSNLRGLEFEGNRFSGVIPAELGSLSQLKRVNLSGNDLSGSLPKEIAGWSQVSELLAGRNGFSGTVPGQIGELRNLRTLDLSANSFTGTLPKQLGELNNLRFLDLRSNELTGSIPPSIEFAIQLRELNLHDNRLTGELPKQLGRLSTLEYLNLSKNELSGSIPVELDGLFRLRTLDLTDNSSLSGPIPSSLTALVRLETLLVGGTNLCLPANQVFHTWLPRLHIQRIRSCAEEVSRRANLTQAVQSDEFPVPLVSREKALLRVFPTASRKTEQTLPRVRAHFYLDGRETHISEISPKSQRVPDQEDPGDLMKSSNIEIPSSVIQSGLEMVVYIDPDEVVDASLGVRERVPKTGVMPVEVHTLPLFELTLIPFIWRETHDSSIVGIVRAIAQNAENHELMQDAFQMLPIGRTRVRQHESVLTESNLTSDLLAHTEAIRVMEGGEGYYMGLIESTGDAGGSAYSPGWSSVSTLNSYLIAHELGHNFSLKHARCGDAPNPDPTYPYDDGTIGTWGFDFRYGGLLIAPTVPDVMSYCEPAWISDYHFSNALRYRLIQSRESAQASRVASKSLLIWGERDANGALRLRPSFIVEAPAVLPQKPGAYRVEGASESGASLFSLTFEMQEIADGSQGGGFAFALPAQNHWEYQLSRITLFETKGKSSYGVTAKGAMSNLQDRRSLAVRGVFEHPKGISIDEREEIASEANDRGMKVSFSRGVPEAVSWNSRP